MIQVNPSKNGASVLFGGAVPVRLLDSFFILRPTLMFPLVTMILAGHHLAAVQDSLAWERWMLLMTSMCAMFGLGYLLNQVRDKKCDLDNGKLFLLSTGVLSRKHLIIEAVLLGITVPAALYLAGYERLIVWVIAMFLIGGILYNFTPVSLQNSPLGGLLAGVAGCWLLLRFGSVVAGYPGEWYQEIPYIIAFGSACLLTDLLDRDGDVENGKKKFAVVYGIKATMIASLAGFHLTAGWGLYNHDMVIAIPAIISLPILWIGCIKNDVSLAVIANKIAIFSLSVAVGIVYPVYLVVIGIYYLLARWYYARRMGLRYPTFGVE
ncbi:UbiA family prenyltransferase [bacterium]|nr:UbiA family prenyltransferase [bacterium]